MKVAIVASSFLPHPGRLERRVDHLAQGLADRGAEVAILTNGSSRTLPRPSHRVTVRRFATAVGPLHFHVAPKLWEQLRTSARGFDIVDVHTRSAPLALAAGSVGVRRLVITPSGAMESFLGFPYTRVMRSLLATASGIVCYSEVERAVLCEAHPWLSRRAQVVPDGVDAAALREATPFPAEETVVLAVDRLRWGSGVERAIAAMPSLPAEFLLVVVGDGPALRRLVAYAADLQVSERVRFVGRVADPVLYRWLRTARVVVTLPAEHGSGTLLTEARAAGAPVVVSDLPVHRQAAERPGGGEVIFVAPKGSPLDVADAVVEAAGLSALRGGNAVSPLIPSWESVVDSTWMLYRELLGDPVRPAYAAGAEVVELTAGVHPQRRNGSQRWP
jgi:glycosyltransferase involved in cell wall biosynthesis